MGIYTTKSPTFIDAYTRNAATLDAKTQREKKELMDGVMNGIKGGVDAYKFAKRKEMFEDPQDEIDALLKENEELEGKLANLHNTGNATYTGFGANGTAEAPETGGEAAATASQRAYTAQLMGIAPSQTSVLDQLKGNAKDYSIYQVSPLKDENGRPYLYNTVTGNYEVMQ